MLQPNKKNKKASVNKKYSNAKKGDSLAEDVFEIFDPTGISSYDDVYRSYKKNGLLSWETGLEVLGALPIIGKAGKGIKIANTTSKYLKALSKVNKVTSKAEKVVPKILKYGKEVGKTIQQGSKAGKGNPVAVASMGIGMGAEAFQKATKVVEKVTKKGVKEIIKKAPANKRVINETVSTINTVNTLSDVAGAVNRKETPVESKKPKVVYYNTNPKNGKVEKPGEEEGVQYVPISNSVQLEKWKAQNNVPVTSDLKTKVARGVLGTVLPDQAAQFLSAIVTKDNKLGLEELTPEQQEALIKSVKNAQKRTGKDSGGTQYIDYSPEVEKAFQGMSAGKKQMISSDPDIQAATILGRVSYKKNALGETEIYDSYDFSKTDPEKADTFYKKVRAYAGTALPDDGKKPNLIGKIPGEEQELAYGTGKKGIGDPPLGLFKPSNIFQTDYKTNNLSTEDYNMKRALELGYMPDETGHWPSVDFETGEWLKSKKHPTRGMEIMAYTLNPELQKNLDLIENEQGNLQYVSKKYVLGTDAEGVDPNKRKLFDESSLTSNGLADVGFSTSSKNFGLNAGVGFNPEDLYGRVGGSFNKKGFNASGEFTQRPEGNYGLNANAGYGNKNINASLGYSKTNDNEFVTGNVSAGSDKLRLIMDYLKNAEGDSINTNLSFNNEIMGASGEPVGTLNSSIGAGVNPEDTFISGALDYSTKAFQQGKGFNYNAGVNYSDLSGPNINAGVKYRFANGTNQEGIMKSKMNPRKRYANGSNLGGIGASNYIETPAETMNDYDIMLAKASQESMSNPWLPVVSLVGGLAQQAVGSLAGKLGSKNIAGNTDAVTESKGASLIKKGINTGGDIDASLGVGVQAAMGMNNVQQDVEVEDGERYKTPAGQTGEFKGATHEENGIPLQVTQDPNANPKEGQAPEGTQIFSDRLKVGDKTIAEREATRERQTANLEKQASQPNIDQAVKNAIKRKMAAIQKEQQMDLAFQGQVNEMQQMADMAVQAFAFGTAMEGIQDNPIGDSMRYGYGTGARGMKKYAGGTPPAGIVYGKGYDASMFKDFFDKYNELNPGGVMDMKYIQGDLGIDSKTPKFGEIFGPTTYKASQDWLAKNKNKAPDGYGPQKSTPGQVAGYFNLPTGFDPTYTPSARKKGMSLFDTTDPFALKGAGDAWAKQNPLPAGVIDPSVPDSIDYQSENFPNFKGEATAEKEKGSGKLRTILEQMGGNAPSIGDLTKLAGNYMGMTAGMKGAYDQRASDVTQTNPFAKAGEDALKALEGMQASIEGQKAQALVNNTTQQRTATKSANNSTRSVNTKRAMNWLYDTAATSAANEIVKNTQAQIAQLGQTKTGILMNRDQMKGQGEYQTNMANMASKDAFTTALTQGRQDFAKGLQQMGADFNSMKENKMIENLMQNYGTYVTVDKSGKLTNKNAVSTKKEEQIFLGPDGKTKFKLGKDNKLIQVT
jgi:hypothetical protein